jgi:quercetin dioxygenase-like cupin family protein
MSHRIPAAAVVLALALPLCALGAQQPAAAHDSMVATRAASVKWAPANVPGFAPGMEIGVVAGDPTQAGPYTLRLRFPSGYAFPPHFHPVDENLTVLSGRFFLAMGEKSQRRALKEYAPGDYLLLPATMPHYGRVVGRTVVQLHGTGPFEIKLVEQPAGASRR